MLRAVCCPGLHSTLELPSTQTGAARAARTCRDLAPTVKERLQAVQRLFWLLLALSVGLLIADATGGNNGPKMEALAELQGFAGQFDQASLEASLLEHARAQGRLPLADVAKDIAEAPGVPELTAANAVIEPHADLDLSTLEALSARGEPSQTKLGVPDTKDLAGGLAFLLARGGVSDPQTLQAVELENAKVGKDDLLTFRKTEQARRKLVDVRKEHARAERRFERLTELLKNRRKWKANWRVLKRTDDKRLEAQAERDALQAQLTTASDAYQALAERAGRSSLCKASRKPTWRWRMRRSKVVKKRASCSCPSRWRRALCPYLH